VEESLHQSKQVSDPVIPTKVKSLLASDDFLKSFQIGVIFLPQL